MNLVLVLLASLLTVAVLMGITALVAWGVGRVAVVDVTWGLGFVVIAWVAALVGDGDLTRRLLLAAMVTVWGGRLAWHVHRRNHGGGEDPRYLELLGKPINDGGFTLAIRKVFLVQGIALWFVSLPVQVAAAMEVDSAALIYVGAAVWLLGMVFETVGDAQLAAYKRDPDRGPVMDRGLWAWTRHPNYFGDACVWWGIWLIACASWPGLLTVLSPAAMTYFLVVGTGAKLLERTMMKRPGYAEYAARTPMFIPRPPRR